MFCIGCASRLPAFVASGPSALETARALRPRAHALEESAAPRRALPAETAVFWLRLGLLVLAMTVGFMGWYVYVTRKAAAPVPAVTAAMPAPAAVSMSPAPRAASMPEPAAPAAPELPAAQAPADASVEAVAKFYRALSLADGEAAAAIVVPAKRGVGPFHEANMSRFYRSLREPLVVRSIRAIDENRVEARYRYRATKTPCEGLAIVETQSVRQQTLIRSIRANC
ncbi:hypothetical protein J7E70_33095 [Variovorax paradoxus]|nr:hypothetical protein [Variovorax paradoxus]MBT2305242.1 hypothetical protein [Variovorax paradoxus]